MRLNESKLIQEYFGLLGGDLDQQLNEILLPTLSKTSLTVKIIQFWWLGSVGEAWLELHLLAVSKERMKALKLAFYWLQIREVPLNRNICVHSMQWLLKLSCIHPLTICIEEMFWRFESISRFHKILRIYRDSLNISSYIIYIQPVWSYLSYCATVIQWMTWRERCEDGGMDEGR